MASSDLMTLSLFIISKWYLENSDSTGAVHETLTVVCVKNSLTAVGSLGTKKRNARH